MAELFVERKDKFLKSLGHRFYWHFHALILLGGYEILLRLFFNPRVIVYDGVDIWFKFAQALTHYGTFAISMGIIIYSLIYLYWDWMGIFSFKEQQAYLVKKRKEGKKFDPSKNKKKPFGPGHKFWAYNVLFGILIGFACGSLMFIFLPYITYLIAGLDGGTIWMPPSIDSIEHLRDYHTNFFQNMALAFGAGFYDELIFRVLLDKWLRRIVKYDRLKKYVTFKQKWANEWFIILIGAMIFAFSHYLIPYGDIFSIYTFLHRILFGILMYWIYIWSNRNFAIIAWTHAFYDMWYFLLI